ncbi:MAG: hypothetical protein K6G01_06685 [Eubacterium sp.]|uniref:Sel1 repeat-containing protein n=1 Tax=Eubacterium oxidoreducens TaxID=1732 RepID=A0A1G6A4X0_EUBOX|nr:hypothetical protein [Eubacterium oxidoreducens]MCR5666500.1 hypothetical protein [Eubacterium sp.]SDB03455.1 hypothetical protein SAMN02910417_00266 [Eubacterium oxidoreducens]
MASDKLIKLVDAASLGDLDAAAAIAKGYVEGDFGKKNYEKALKWGRYAAKRGHEEAAKTVALAEELMSKDI